MRPAIYVACALALAALAPQTVAALVAGAASIVLECVPYLVVAALAAPVAPWLGCGCGNGPAARSIPAALATAALFGIPVALARLAAATAVARRMPHHEHGAPSDLLAELARLAPSAVLAAGVAIVVPVLPLHALTPPLALLLGAVLGAIASPCALGGVALAATLRASAPWAAAGVLGTAGIIDIFAWRGPRRFDRAPDPWAYLVLGVACALVAWHHGGTFVHPRMTLPLACCALVCAILAWQARGQTARTGRAVAGMVLAVVVIGAPAPVYRATETTLSDAFPGEHVDFTGTAVSAHMLVRYAITCCRADAAPVALMLDRNVARDDGTWLRARGTLVNAGGSLRLHVEQLTAVAAPTDPFVYR